MTLTEMRALLADQIAGLHNGTANPTTANAIARQAGMILSSLRVELQYRKARNETPRIDMIDRK